MRLSLLLLLAAPALADTITVDVGRGPITVHVPDSYDPAAGSPLVVLLHGYSGNGPGQEAYMDFLSVHEEYGFHYCYPNGTLDNQGNRFWNATDACCDFGPTGVDDSSYLASLIDAIEAQVTVDPRRIYFIGHSNGGFMSYRMACDHSERVAAICSLAGAAWNDPADCGATSPVHVLQIHGTNDNVIFYGGGQIQGNIYPGAVASVEQWATLSGCDLTPDGSAASINLDASIPGKETTKLKYGANCDARGRGEVWTIQGGTHGPNISNPFPGHVIEWLYEHPKPGIDFERYCSPAQPNSSGQPGVLTATGSDALAHNDLTLTASDLPLGQFGYFVGSLDQGFVQPPGSDGDLCLANDIARFVTSIGNSGASGEISAQLSLNNVPTNPSQNVVTGQTWNFQLWHRDGSSSNFTEAVSVLFR